MPNYYKFYTTKQLKCKDPTAHNIDSITEVIKKRKMPSFIQKIIQVEMMINIMINLMDMMSI